MRQIITIIAAVLFSAALQAQTITQIIDASGDGTGNALSSVTDIAVDDSGNIYVTSELNDDAFRIAPGGSITQIIDMGGDGSSSLDYANAVAVDNSGNAFVAGLSSNNIFRIDAADLVSEIIDSSGDGAAAANSAAALAMDASGTVYAAFFGSSNAFSITPGGVITELISSAGDGSAALAGASGISLDDAGNIYVAGQLSDNVFKISSGGMISEIIDSSGDGAGNALDAPIGVATDTQGNVFVTGRDSNNVFRISAAGLVTEIIDGSGDGSAVLTTPWGLETDTQDNVFVSGGASNNVFRITPAGVITEVIDSSGDGVNSLFNPSGLATDKEDKLYVAGRDSNNAFSVFFPSSIGSASYDASAGILAVSGINFRANSAADDIDASVFSVTGEGGETVTLGDTADVEISSSSEFSLNLAPADRNAVNLLLNRNGGSSTGGTTFNLAVADDWFTAPSSVDNSTATIALTVHSVAIPAVNSASYNVSSGVLSLSGSNFLSSAGAANDIDASLITLTGNGSASHTLTDTADVDVAGSSSVSLTLSAGDRSAVNALLNANGSLAADGTSYNLALADGWATGADAPVDSSVGIASLSVSGVPRPLPEDYEAMDLGQEQITLSLESPMTIEIAGGVGAFGAASSQPSVASTVVFENELKLVPRSVGAAVISVLDRYNQVATIVVTVQESSPQPLPDPEPEPEPEPEPGASPPESFALFDGNGNAVAASVDAGVTADQGQSYAHDSSFSVGEAIQIVFEINPATEHIGLDADIFVILADAANPSLGAMLTASGEILPFEGTLLPFRTGLVLEESLTVNLTDGVDIPLTGALRGSYLIWIGYELADGTRISQVVPLSLEVF